MAGDRPDRVRPAGTAGADDRYEDRYAVAARYYLRGQTMATIAAHLKLSRSTVSRLLKEARDQGLVRIALADTVSSSSPPAVELGRRFGARVQVVPVPANASPVTRLERVARRAGTLLAETVRDHDVVGVSGGRTIARTVHHLLPRALVGVTAVQLNGSAGPQVFGTSPGEILRDLGRAFGAELVVFPVPTFFDRPATRDVVWRERSVQEVLAVRGRVQVALFGVGTLRGSALTDAHVAGFLGEEEADVLTADGVAGEVCTVLLREDGTYADLEHNRRATGPTPAELRRIPRRICVVADPARSLALVAALRAGVVTDLVVDEETARAVLARVRHDDERAASRPPTTPPAGGRRP